MRHPMGVTASASRRAAGRTAWQGKPVARGTNGLVPEARMLQLLDSVVPTSIPLLTHPMQHPSTSPQRSCVSITFVRPSLF